MSRFGIWCPATARVLDQWAEWATLHGFAGRVTRSPDVPIPGGPVWHPLRTRRREHRNGPAVGMLGRTGKQWQALTGPATGLPDLQ